MLGDPATELLEQVSRWPATDPYAAQQKMLALAYARQLVAENERLTEQHHRITQWCKAYPLECFPEPDLNRAHEVLKAHGMGLDAISASNMRHVLKGIQRIIDSDDD